MGFGLIWAQGVGLCRLPWQDALATRGGCEPDLHLIVAGAVSWRLFSLLKDCDATCKRHEL